MITVKKETSTHLEVTITPKDLIKLLQETGKIHNNHKLFDLHAGSIPIDDDQITIDLEYPETKNVENPS